MTPRRLVTALLAAAGVLTSAFVPLAAPAVAGTISSLAMGDSFDSLSGSIASSAGYKRFPSGPDVGAPTAIVDTQAHTVALTVDDAGRQSVLTMAWPARTGLWSLSVTGTDAEQHVKLQRGALDCFVTSGTLDVRQALVGPDGGVAALTADVRHGMCNLGQNSGGYAGFSVRIGSTEVLPGVGRAEPALVDTGALVGTPVTQRVVITNVGEAPWTVRTTGVGSTSSWFPLFTVVAGSDTCTGATLAPGAQCEVTVSATAPAYLITEQLVVAGDGAADVVVPLRLEGYAPVPAPTGVSSVAGRLGVTLSWAAPAVNPTVGYRVYDVSGGVRTLVATAAASAQSVDVPGHGPRSLALVAANGRFAESPDVPVQTPAVTSEVVAQDHYADVVGFAVPQPGVLAAGRTSTLFRYLRLDPSRTSWVTPTMDGVRVCSVDREECTTLSATGPSGPVGQLQEAVWLPDGRIAMLAQAPQGTFAVWVVNRDGTSLRRVKLFPSSAFDYSALAAAPDDTQVLVLGGTAARSIQRVRLADGLVAPVPGAVDIEDFTVTTSGQLVLQRQADPTRAPGPTRISITALDGSGARDLTLPPGDNRSVTFDPTGTRVAFVRHTSEYEGTVWVAAADGSGAREISGRVGDWRELQWSTDDAAAPVAGLAGPAVSAATVSLSVGAADADDAVGSLRRECRVDGALVWTTCGPTWAVRGLTSGRHTAYVRVSDPSGRQSATVSHSWIVDGSPPTTSIAPLAVVQTASRFTLSWASVDTGGAGVATYDVRMRRASAFGGWSRYLYPAVWQGRTSRAVALTVSPGWQICFSVRARDKVGNVGAWSADRCTSVTLDDRSLRASSGWVRGTSSRDAFGTWSRAARTGVSLARLSVQARRIAVVVVTCPTCGALDVYHAGRRVGRVSLYSSRTAYRQVRWLPLESGLRTGSVVLRTVNGRPVIVDGIAVLH